MKVSMKSYDAVPIGNYPASSAQDAPVALAAGASIGIIADVILFPLDFIKTRQQGKAPISANGRLPSPQEAVEIAGNVASALERSNLLTRSGASRPAHEAAPCALPRLRTHKRLSSCYSGIAALAMGSMPSSAGFFFMYEVTKDRLKFAGFDSSRGSTHILSAAIAESSACVIRNPFEVVKQQVQLGLHPSTAAGFANVWRHEGLRGFFVGMGTSMLRDVPFAALQLSLWEWMKLKSLGKNPPPTHFSAIVSGAAGMVAGAIAAVVTTPMDVAKTRLMTQEPGARQYRGFFHCLSSMLWNEGVSSLFLGVKVRCLWVALGGGIFLGGYDAFKVLYRQLFERHSLFQMQSCCVPCANAGDPQHGVLPANAMLGTPEPYRALWQTKAPIDLIFSTKASPLFCGAYHIPEHVNLSTTAEAFPAPMAAPR
ncbi:hypothetical protein Efla_000628 [Eimeria flavescens]